MRKGPKNKAHLPDKNVHIKKISRYVGYQKSFYLFYLCEEVHDVQVSIEIILNNILFIKILIILHYNILLCGLFL